MDRIRPFWRILQLLLLVAIIAFGWGCELCLAHPISVSRTEVSVSRDLVTVTIEGFVEDLFLFHNLKVNEQDVLEPKEIMRGVELNKEFLPRKFKIRNVAGEPLKLLGVSLKHISPLGNGVSSGELMDYDTIFELRYDLSLPPEYLTFSQRFTRETDIQPAEMLLRVKQENAGTPYSVMLMPHRPETLRFNWDNPALSHKASGEEWDAWYEKQKLETLGIMSHKSVYSFLYVEDHQVRYEILMPLHILKESIPLDRNGDEFLDLSEQTAARALVGNHFLGGSRIVRGGNRIQINGSEVSGRVARLDFYGLDVTDFAKPVARKRVPMGSGRVGITLTYPSAKLPETVELTWDRFSRSLRSVKLAVFAGGDTLSTTLDIGGGDNVFRWKNPSDSPNASVPRPAKVAVDRTERVFVSLLQNVYEAFQFREQSDRLAALAVSLHGDLVADFDGLIGKGRVMPEQGGAVAELGDVTVLKGERVPLPTGVTDQKRAPAIFAYHCEWKVVGTVEHWGHIHERTNQYSAVFTVEPIDRAWKITAVDKLREKRLPIKTRLRPLPSPSE